MTYAIDTNAFLRSYAASVDTRVQDQIRFASALAINDTMKEAQGAQRAALRKEFDVKRAAFADLTVKIVQFASKAETVGKIGIVGPNGAPSRGDIYGKFEETGKKVSIGGRHLIAYPGRDIRTTGGHVKRGTELSLFAPFVNATRLSVVRHRGGLNGSKRRTTRENVTARVGQGETWFATLRKGRNAGREALLQRYGRGRRDVRLLYLFVPAVPLKARLGFEQTVRRAVDARFEHHFLAALDKALLTAR